MKKMLGRSGATALALFVAACNGTSTTDAGSDAPTTADAGTDSTMSDVSMMSDAGTDANPMSDAGTDAGTDATADAAPTGRDFATAFPLTIDDPASTGALRDAMSFVYYRFEAAAGDRLVLAVTAQQLGGATEYDPTRIDPIVTVYDAAMQQIARNDDPHPWTNNDPVLFFEAPAAGTYYVKVGDCNGVLAAGMCNSAANITTFDYEVQVAHTTNLVQPEANAAATQDGTTAHAQPLTYRMPAGAMPGHYGFHLIDGNFASTTSTHVYSFTPPADTSFTGRARAEFFVQATGTNGNGSTSNVRIWVTDSTGSSIVAQVDQNDSDPARSVSLLSVPVSLGQQYYLFVRNTAATSAPATDYYFIEHSVGTFFAAETETEGPTGSGGNDVSATAQLLTATTTPGVTSFSVDANISSPTDVDYFRAPIPTGAHNVIVACDAARTGSGLLGFTATLFDQSGVTMIGSTLGPEASPPSGDLVTAQEPLPAGATSGTIRITTTGQSPTVMGTSYRCQIYYL